MDLILSTPVVGLNSTELGYDFTKTLIRDKNGLNAVGPDYTFMPEMDDLGNPFINSANINKTAKQYSSRDTVQRFLRNIVTPTICLLGFLGNIVNIIVLSRLRSLRTDSTRDNGTHFGLIVLAVSDMLFCLSMFPRILVPESSSLFEHKNFHWFYQVSVFYMPRILPHRHNFNVRL